ncbi:MAG: putative cytokinetic ring protein SteA [Acidimicrobiia bacterium]|nr:putative cytokinetic ring protein SteA [Acidimicrobiia bacterium]
MSPREVEAPTQPIVGRARIGRRTKDLIKRLGPGDIAVIDHRDIDRVAADGLIESGVEAVLNAAPSISGRYPNGGPIRIVRAGIPLVDDLGSDLLDSLRDGDTIRLDGGTILRADEVVAQGPVLRADDIVERMEEARVSIGGELQRFAANTLEYVEKEATLTFEPIQLPELRTDFTARHALVVVRGHDYRHDLKTLRAYIREFRPVLIGVDGGADALLELGFTPDLIIGDFDSVSEPALATGAELIHHVHPDGRAPGREALLEWGLPYEEFIIEGTSEDAAMLLAYEAGARLIVAVGTHATMVEFLDKGRPGMSSTFLTRLRLGPVLVDAKGVTQLYETRVRRSDLAMLVGAALVAVLVITIVSEPIHVFFDGVWLTLRDFWLNVTNRF